MNADQPLLARIDGLAERARHPGMDDLRPARLGLEGGELLPHGVGAAPAAIRIAALAVRGPALVDDEERMAAQHGAPVGPYRFGMDVHLCVKAGKHGGLVQDRRADPVNRPGSRLWNSEKCAVMQRDARTAPPHPGAVVASARFSPP